MKNLSGDLFITTTPSVGSQFFPKSKISPKSLRPKYLYLFHSLVSPNEMYVKNSFKKFDYIFSPSKVISEQIQPLIGKTCKVFDTGYLLFDSISPFEYQTTKKNKALIAPTWGNEAVKKIADNIKVIVSFLNQYDIEAVFRPHPMTRLADLKLDKSVEIDLNRDLKNLHEYDILLTDYSGIALEYFYLTGKYVIFLNVPKKIKRKVSKTEVDFIEDKMRTIIGKSVDIETLYDLILPINLDEAKAKDFILLVTGASNPLEKSVEIIDSEIIYS